MLKHVDYLFTASVSSASYRTKEEATEALNQSEGVPAMAWVAKEVTRDEMLDFCLTGHSYCNLFHNPNGDIYSHSFHSWNKTSDNFSGSYVVTIDVDDFGESASKYDFQVNNFISELSQSSLVPSLWYTSFSHQPAEQKLKVHLLYVFDSLIPGRDGGQTYKILAEAICQKITITSGVPTDKCSLTASQYTNPTNVDNQSLCVEFGISHIVYSFEDFGVSNLGEIWQENVKAYVPKSKPLTVSKTLIDDYRILSLDDFLRKYGARYRFYYRMEDEYEWHSTSTSCDYAVIDDRYFALYFNRCILKDGQGRRKKIFERMCERRLIKPDATPNQIAYCAIKDIYFFIDNGDNALDHDYIKRNVNSCFELSLIEIQQRYSRNIAYLKTKAPKRNLIYKYKAGMTQAQKAKVRKKINAERVFNAYDVSLSPEENCRELKSTLDISISPSTLYKYFSEYGFDYGEYKRDKRSEKKKLVQQILDEMSQSNTAITVKGLRLYLKDKNIKLNNNDCSRYIREYKSLHN